MKELLQDLAYLLQQGERPSKDFSIIGLTVSEELEKKTNRLTNILLLWRVENFFGGFSDKQITYPEFFS